MPRPGYCGYHILTSSSPYFQLEDAEDGFSVIADYFSKNTMAFAKLID